jgi:hypothetical protein
MAAIRLLPTQGTLATLAIDGPAAASFNTIVRAKREYEGPAGNLITLALAAGGLWVPNIGTLTLVANPADTETCTIGAQVYTFQTVLTNVAGNVLIGASASATLDNLIAAINGAAGAGTTYAAATVEHTQVRAFAGAGDTMIVHTRPTILTAVGTLIATTDGMANAGNVWGAATLADGTDGTNVAFSVTGTAISVVFSSGYTCVEDFEAALAAHAATSALIEVSTAGTTPLYQLVVTDDDFTATALTGGGSTSSGVPTAGSSTVGVAIPQLTDEAIILVRSIAGSGTMEATLRLWGYSPEVDQWYSIGLLNGGSAIAEVDSNYLAHAELVVGLRAFSRLYCEIESLGGTATEVEVYAHCVPAAFATT